MSIGKALVFSILISAFAGSAWATVLTADQFVAMRLIRNAYPDIIDPGARRDGSIYRTGGITNAGNLFGDSIWTEHASGKERFDQPIRWMRSTGYEPEIVNGGLEHLLHVNHGGDTCHNQEICNNQVVLNESYLGWLNGWHRETPGQRHRGVTPDGFAVGGINSFNFHIYHYDINNDVVTDMGPGWATGVNANGLVTSVWSSCCGSHNNGYYSKVLSLHATEDDKPAGYTHNPERDPELEVAAWPTELAGFENPFPFAINNQNIIVGNMGSIFLTDRQPMKQVPTGENTWSDPIQLDALENAGAEGGTVLFSSSIMDISNNVDRPFGVGISGTPSHAVVWDINSGQIVADFGSGTTAWQISGNGTKVAGLRTVLNAFPPRNVPIVWSTADGWENFTELDLNEALDSELGLDGTDLWLELTDIDGVNDSGQVVGSGTIVAADGFSDQQALFLLDTLQLEFELKGDVNNDGAIDNLDITAFIAAVAAADEAAFLVDFPQGNYTAADVDMSGSPDNLDITPFIGLLTAAAGASAVPEPASVSLLIAGLVVSMTRGFTRRRAASFS